MTAFLFIILAIASYLLGNIHFAKIVSKFKKEDITKRGSGNPGTMNMLRTHGFLTALITLVLDALKGAIPALVGFYVFGGTDGGLTSLYIMHIFGMLSVIGHIYPIVYGFKGGKGVATALGYFTVVNPLVSLVLFAIGLLLFIITKIGSLSSLVYVLLFFVSELVWKWSDLNIIPFICMFIVLVIIYVRHYENIVRIFNKSESKINILKTTNNQKNDNAVDGTKHLNSDINKKNQVLKPEPNLQTSEPAAKSNVQNFNVTKPKANNSATTKSKNTTAKTKSVASKSSVSKTTASKAANKKTVSTKANKTTVKVAEVKTKKTDTKPKAN